MWREDVIEKGEGVIIQRLEFEDTLNLEIKCKWLLGQLVIW